MSWFTSYKNEIKKERVKKVGKETADYGKDYCIPMKGIKSIYTNYWFRPKIRFKGLWDAETVGSDRLIPKDHDTYRAECSEYVTTLKIDNDFLGKMMFDYLFSWANDNDLKNEGVVAFIGADDKAFCSDQSVILSSTENKKDCNRGNDGVRGRAGSDGEKPEEQKAEKETEKFQDEGDGYVWDGSLTWSSLTSNGNIKNKAEVGQMYGLTSSNAEGFKKLKGLVVHV